jgi:hypothetical protein
VKVLAVLLVLLALAGAALAATPSAPAPGRTIPCKEIILGTKWPYIGNRQPEQRYRIVLGAVSVPPAYMPQVEGPEPGAWPYWRKSGLVVKAGAGPVTISVAPAVRGRAAIEWGNAGHGPFNSIRLARCADGSGGYAYAGGFSLRSPSACVPLIFRVGSRSETVRFGVGRRC